jgi:phosphoribosylglycinamide formyltransferase-1
MNFAFYVSGNAGRLRELIKQHSHVLKRTKLVITDSEANEDLKPVLQSLKINYYKFNYKARKENREESINQKLSDFILKSFNTHQIDYCFCFGDHILEGQLLTTYKSRIINFHPSVLPMHPGRYSIDKAMKDDSTILLGNTAHFVDEGIDTGTIIMQSVISKDLFIKGGYEAVLNIQLGMLNEIYNCLREGWLIIKDNKVYIPNKLKSNNNFLFNGYEK